MRSPASDPVQPSLLPTRNGALLALGLTAAIAAILLGMGRVPICTCGYVTLWWSDPNSFGNSQMLADWYAPSHFIHGLLFYFFAHLLFVRWPGKRAGAARSGRMPGPHLQRLALPIAVGVEGLWEILENSPLIIERYRSVTVNYGYNGDSVLNSLSDVACMVLGFLVASRLPVRASVALAVGLELLTLWAIRDNLTLNVVMLVWPIQAIRAWQGG
jgi:hypothetical protein